MENTIKQKHSQSRKHQGFLDAVLSWSLSDILNNDLYQFQVEELPLTFSSTTQYMNSFIYLLFEETRADLLSQLSGIPQAPTSLISGLQRIQTGGHKKVKYLITLRGMNYLPKVGDLIALTQVKPKCIDDLDRPNSPFIIAYVNKLNYGQSQMTVIMSSDLMDSEPKTFVVYLTTLTTNMRIWNALNPECNMNVIQRTLSLNPSVAKNCVQCGSKGEKGVIDLKLRKAFDSFKLDTSQEAAVLSCLAAKNCSHQKSCTKLIWGPPGTGKTKTIASLLFVLLRTKHRTLTCAPTNIAVVGVVKRLLSLVINHDLGCDTYGFGDILLYGNEERMKINEDHEQLLDVFLDNRVEALFSSLSRWKSYVNVMIQFLENPLKEYSCFRALQPKKTKANRKKKKKKKKNEQKLEDNLIEPQCTFEEFAINRFNVLGKNLISCIRNIYTHLPTSVIPLNMAKKMHLSVDLIQKVGDSVKEMVARNKSLKEVFNKGVDSSINKSPFSKLKVLKTDCLHALKELQATSCIPKSMSEIKLKSFCLRNAYLIFCTVSSSIKLSRNGMTPIELVLIDEAAQVKECESIIPLQLRGVRNVVLVGDQRQLPSMVHSKICKEAKFGRSLFERLVSLRHEKHLLNVQYRMHPLISQFPKTEFYDGQILDGSNVIDKSYGKCFLKGSIYGPYSFINVDYAKEELDKNNHSTRNMVEVAVIAEIIANLFKESFVKRKTVTVGCISPYKAQVDAIQAKVGKKYDRVANGWSFSVNVRSVDGFQGGEEDIIIFSTVRCNIHGSVGFLSSHERANVALTRARHCLWIVGNKETMIKSGSVWNTLVYDAESRGCVYNARDDKNLVRVMVNAIVELADYGSLFKSDSILFKEAKWKVNFTHTFLKRMDSLVNLNVRKLVVSLLMRLSNGWRQLKKDKQNSYNNTRETCNMLETYNVDGNLYLVWSVDLVYGNSSCVQVLKVWDILPLSRLRKCQNLVQSAFETYTYDMISRCQSKRFERNLVFPITWPEDSGHDPTWALTSRLSKLTLITQ